MGQVQKRMICYYSSTYSKQLSKEIIVLFGSIFVFTGWGGGWWDGAKTWKQKGEVSFASIVSG